MVFFGVATCSNYSMSTFVKFIGDEESLAKLRAKAAEQDFDFSASREQRARHLKKETDGEIRAVGKARREGAEGLVKSLTDPRSRAMAQMHLAAARLGDFAIGEATGAADWLGDLRKAAKDVPCSNLHSTFEVALEIAALEKLAAVDPECAAIIEADRRLLSAGEIIRLLVRAKGELGEKVRKLPLVVEARENAFTVEDRFPAGLTLEDWVLLEGLHPEKDARLHELTANNGTRRVTVSLMHEISLEDPSMLLGDYWQKVFDGDVAGAKEIIPKLEAAGLKLPPLS